jgi:tagatose 1,6-diphosphate aldolase
MDEFRWIDPNVLVDKDLALVLVEKSPAQPSKGYVPAYQFEMRRNGKPEKIGNISLRVGDTYRLRMYGGHIGYGVDPEHRGHHYAARACRLLFPLARRHGMREIWITCNPENAASRRTCELAGAEFVEIVDLPEDSDMYQEGERQKCRYRIDLL